MGVSDAGLRREARGSHVGMGWALLDRKTKEFIVVAQWYRWEAGAEQGQGRFDINFWELRAAKSALAAVVALRSERLGEIACIPCATLSPGVRSSVKRKLCCS